MDRNEITITDIDFRIVALRKESVDRNVEEYLNAGSLDRSLSARRAWIEIFAIISLIYQQAVALRKESVDRNCLSRHLVRVYPVALRKESVDRNVSLYGFGREV